MVHTHIYACYIYLFYYILSTYLLRINIPYLVTHKSELLSCRQLPSAGVASKAGQVEHLIITKVTDEFLMAHLVIIIIIIITWS